MAVEMPGSWGGLFSRSGSVAHPLSAEEPSAVVNPYVDG
jgi:hypothetical protein